MMCRPGLSKAVAVLGIGILCLPVLLFLAPDIEEGRNEAQLSSAFHDVQRLHRALAAGADRHTAIALPELDPWGRPYQVIPLEGGRFRVLSSGPDMSSSATGVGDDDIYSDMPGSPIDAIVARKKQQLFLAVAASAGCWIALSALYLWPRTSAGG